MRLLLCRCVLLHASVQGLSSSALRPLAVSRWAGRAGAVVCATNDTTSSLPLIQQARSRAKNLLEAEDFEGAALESAAVLEVLPELADIARMRGRALLDPILDQMIDGTPLSTDPTEELQAAYEAFRLAAVMDPDTNAEARMELKRIRDLSQRLNGAEAAGKGTSPNSSPADSDNPSSLRFDLGARVECCLAVGQWGGGTVVGRYYREPEWPQGQVVPYQIQLDGGRLIYAPEDTDACIRAEPSSLDTGLADGPDDEALAGLDADVIIVGAGAAGIGCAFSLTNTFGLDPSRVLLLERGEDIGTSFRLWPEEMKFISPSFNQQGWTSSFDLNSIAHGTSPAFSLHAQHPSGAQYAEYLNALATDANLDVKLRTEVAGIERNSNGVFDVRVRAAGVEGAPRETLRARFVVWAAGEFQYPREGSATIPGAELCMHNSRVRSWASHPGDEHVIIGGCVPSGRSRPISLRSRCSSLSSSPRRPISDDLPPHPCFHTLPPHPASTPLPISPCSHPSPVVSAATRAEWMRPSTSQRRASGAPCSPRPPRGMSRRPTRPPSWLRTRPSGFARSALQAAARARSFSRRFACFGSRGRQKEASMSSPRGKQRSLLCRHGRSARRSRARPPPEAPKGASWWCTRRSHPCSAPGLQGASPPWLVTCSTFRTARQRPRAALPAHPC